MTGYDKEGCVALNNSCMSVRLLFVFRIDRNRIQIEEILHGTKMKKRINASFEP